MIIAWRDVKKRAPKRESIALGALHFRMVATIRLESTQDGDALDPRQPPNHRTRSVPLPHSKMLLLQIA
jgi:hypothetical protein